MSICWSITSSAGLYKEQFWFVPQLWTFHIAEHPEYFLKIYTLTVSAEYVTFTSV